MFEYISEYFKPCADSLSEKEDEYKGYYLITIVN